MNLARDAELWSTLGYDALVVMWGLPQVELRDAPEALKHTLARWTIRLQQRDPARLAELCDIVLAVDPHARLAMLRELSGAH